MTKLFAFIVFPIFLIAQEECLLGVGGKDDEVIKKVFQLTDKQAEQMRNWGAEIEFRNEIFERRAASLLKNHAQSSPEDLLKMSIEYGALLDSIQANFRLIDKRLLSIFNQEQYNLYIMLCNQVSRSPIYTSRSVNEK